MTDEQDPTPSAPFRAFVREHHPDRGGDPDVFAAGLARFGASRGRRPGPTTRASTHPSRWSAPLPFPVRVGVALIRTWRRRRAGR